MTATLQHRPTTALAGHFATRADSTLTLIVAVLGFFVVTLDAVIVNVALPSVRADLGGGIAGMQWVADGYTLMFAALLLTSGVLTDRIGARRAFGAGMIGFVVASMACAMAPSLGTLIAARFGQGAAAAVMMPSSMALIGQAYPDRAKRSRAVAMWAMGGAIASSSGPVLGGLLTLASWRLIFVINAPVGVAAMLLVARIPPSPRRPAPLDATGPIAAVIAMGALTFGAIEAGATGLTDPRVVVAFVVAVTAVGVFVSTQRHKEHPMVPPDVVRTRNVSVASAVGFAFIVGYYGLPFVMSLFLQQQRGLSPFETGLVFLPMMVVGALLTPFSARAAERISPRLLVSGGLVLMAVGLVAIAATPASAPVWAFSGLMAVVGLAGPPIMPPITGVLLNSVRDHQSGTASGLFNTSRQIGGALSVAVFGALLSSGAGFMHGLRVSLAIAAGIALTAAVISRLQLTSTHAAANGNHLEGAVA